MRPLPSVIVVESTSRLAHSSTVEVPVAFSYDALPDEAPVLSVRVAGVDLENPTVTGALVEALLQEEGSETDTSRLDFAGHIDADCSSCATCADR